MTILHNSGSHSGDAALRIIDISRIAHPLRFVNLANYFMLVGGLSMILAFVPAAITSRASGPELAGIAIFAIAYGICAWVGWRNIGVLSAVVDRYTTLGLAVLAVVSGFLALSNVSTFLAGPNLDDTATKEAVLAATNGGLSAAAALAGIVALALVRRLSLPALGLGLRTFLSHGLSSQDAPGGTYTLPPADARKGILFLATGIVWLIGFNFIPNSFFLQSSAIARLMVPISQIGFVFLIYARHHFRPGFMTVTATDRRPPVLLLRSFVDDEKVNYQRADAALFDFSLESRLAGHFSAIGPFIAVGAPKDDNLHLGAVRATLSDEEWQGIVVRWIYDARLIVLMAGTTHWIGWELKKIVDAGRTNKLIVLFPPIKKLRRKKNAEQRLEMVRVAFAGTIWKPALDKLDRPSRIRSIVFEPSGSVVVVTSRPRNRESYHLAALIAQHLLQPSRIAVSTGADAWIESPRKRGARRSLRVAVATLCVAAALGAVYVGTKKGAGLFASFEPMEPLPAAIAVKADGRLRVGNLKFVGSRNGSAGVAVYRPGNNLQLTYDVMKFGNDQKGFADVRCEMTVLDPSGLPVHEPLTSRFHETIASTDRIIESLEVNLPAFAPRGEYRIDIKVHDIVENSSFEFQPRFLCHAPALPLTERPEIRDLELSLSPETAKTTQPLLIGAGKVQMRCSILGLTFKHGRVNATLALRLIGPDGSVVLNRPDYLKLDEKAFYHPPTFKIPVTGHVSIPEGFRRGVYVEEYVVVDHNSGRRAMSTASFEVR